jgi:hypothetical protein
MESVRVRAELQRLVEHSEFLSKTSEALDQESRVLHRVRSHRVSLLNLPRRTKSFVRASLPLQTVAMRTSGLFDSLPASCDQ